MFSKLLEYAKDAAPWLAGAAGTAVTGNPAAGALLAGLARKITGDEESDLDTVAGQIISDPEKLAEFRLRARELDLKELELRTKDTQHARETHKDSRAPAIISALVVAGFFGAVALIMLRPLPEGSQNLAYLLLGTLGGAFSTVLAFWLGSSKGSKDKDRIMSSFSKAARLDQKARG